jgi:hypothetical protein
MSIDLEHGRATERKSRVEKPEVKKDERPTLRVRPRGSVQRDKLFVPDEVKAAYPDSYFVFENDEMGRVQARERVGWSIVRGDWLDGNYVPNHDITQVGSVYRIPVGRGQTTDNLYAVLMCIPMEWWQEDLAKQQESAEEIESSLRRKPQSDSAPGEKSSVRVSSFTRSVDR